MPKAKIKIAKLVQSGGTANDPAVIVTLRADQEAMATGLMGGCCSAILLWGWDAQRGRYQNMRGHHADADPGHIAWQGLIAGVPNDPQQAKLIIACAKDNLDGTYGYRGKVEKALRATATPPIRFGDGRPCALTPSFYGFSDVLVFRNGIVIALTSQDYAQYQVD